MTSLASQPGSLPPPPFPFDHPAQSLMAGGAAKPLAGTATSGGKVLFTARPIAAKKWGFPGWALTLAGRRGARA
jgi:hypothetical protein